MNVLAMVTADRIATTHTVTEGAEFPLLLIRGLERMLAGVVGTSGSRREYSVLGDSVNLSARLM